MTVNFKNLELLPQLLEEINHLKNSFENRIEKRWFSTKEVAEYLDYSQDRLHKLKGSEFIEGIHYHKRSGKLLFDKNKIDEWVLGIDVDYHINIESKVTDIIKDLSIDSYNTESRSTCYGHTQENKV